MPITASGIFEAVAVIAVNSRMNHPGGYTQPNSRITSVNVWHRRDAYPGPSRRTPLGIAPLVQSAYARDQRTCLSPGLASLDRLERPAVLVGYREECALIGASLDRAAADDAISLRGEPGAGRTVLLDAAADGASAAGAWVLRAAGARELADRPPPRWTRQESPELRHTAREASSAPCSAVSRPRYPRPAPAYTAAGRTGDDIPTICGWEAPDEPACIRHR